MAIQTIITAYEVVTNSPAGRDYPTDWICKLIPRIEQEFGYDCLGEELYEWLLANVTAYPESAVEWESETSYDEGAYVIRNGCLYVSMLDCNRNDPLEDPDGTWDAAKRFGTNNCANELWEDHLKPLLALKIFERSLNPATRKVGAGGLVTLAGNDNFNGQGFRSGTKTELSDYKTDLVKEIESAHRNMVRWAKRKIDSGETCTVPLTSIPGCGVCAVQTNSVRRWGFRQ